MQLRDLRIALFSGNYNFVKDGANQALNRLMGYMLQQGAAVRVYAPTTDTPAFAPTGDLVSLPSMPFPGRSEYQFPLGLGADIKRDLAAFAPNIVHASSPDVSAHRAVSWARGKGLPILGSVHTRFETYPRYYNMAFMEPVIIALLRRFYRRCDALVAPTESVAAILRSMRMNSDIGVWSRGVDRSIFHPSARSLAWRRDLGIGDEEIVIGFLGRIVLEKGLGAFADTIALLESRNIPHRLVVIGEGPARAQFASRMPKAQFVGFQMGADLGRAVASLDILFNPSLTEAFGNVTLEAMACGVPVVAAQATGADALIVDGENGLMVAPDDVPGYAAALTRYITDPALRAAHGAIGDQRAQAYGWDAINHVVAETYLRLCVSQPK